MKITINKGELFPKDVEFIHVESVIGSTSLGNNSPLFMVIFISYSNKKSVL